MIGMLFYWLGSQAPRNIKQVEVIFPVAGHSFIPPDRVFAQLEKKIKTKQTIIDVADYLNIYREHGTTFSVGKDCPVLDFKTEVSNHLRPPGTWHFKFMESKRMILTRKQNGECVIRGETFYKSDIGVARSVQKRGKTIRSMRPATIQPGVTVKKEKLADVDKLLQKHFGVEWKENPALVFYKDVMQTAAAEPIITDRTEDSICEENLEVEDLRI